MKVSLSVASLMLASILPFTAGRRAAGALLDAAIRHHAPGKGARLLEERLVDQRHQRL